MPPLRAAVTVLFALLLRGCCHLAPAYLAADPSAGSGRRFDRLSPRRVPIRALRGC